MAKRVLIAEDDEPIRAMVRSVLHREGFEVVVVDNGDDAIAHLTDQHFDAVVVDVALRVGTGQGVLDILAFQRPDIRCVVVIAATSAAELEKVPAANVQAKLRKPFEISELIAAIELCVVA